MGSIKFGYQSNENFTIAYYFELILRAVFDYVKNVNSNSEANDIHLNNFRTHWNVITKKYDVPNRRHYKTIKFFLQLGKTFQSFSLTYRNTNTRYKHPNTTPSLFATRTIPAKKLIHLHRFTNHGVGITSTWSEEKKCSPGTRHIRITIDVNNSPESWSKLYLVGCYGID